LVVFGPDHRPAAFNSALMLPGLITPEECKTLREACNTFIRDRCGGKFGGVVVRNSSSCWYLLL
jgi:hypothetical protein